jgi:hypothetical protein
MHQRDVCLLSLERCRARLPGDCELSDADLERLRDGLYALAGVAVDGYLTNSSVTSKARQWELGNSAPRRRLAIIKEGIRTMTEKRLTSRRANGLCSVDRTARTERMNAVVYCAFQPKNK